MSLTSAATGEHVNVLSDYQTVLTPKLDPQPTRITLDTTGVLRVYDSAGNLMVEFSGYYQSYVNRVIDRWPNRAIALVENYALDSAPIVLGWFMPMRIRKPGM